MSGYQMQRGWMDHPLFEGEKYTRAQAWEWMISEAAWKDTIKRLNGNIMPIKRGQFSHSIRFMAERFRWPKSNVSRFIQEIHKEGMIILDNGTKQSLITVCNYESYQLTPGKNGTMLGQCWDNVGTKKNKENKTTTSFLDAGEKVSLDELSTDHISAWLIKKRAKGHYIHHDAELVLEKFKDYCQSKGKKYADYVAAYRGAFDWEKCRPAPRIITNPRKHGAGATAQMAGTINNADNRDPASRAHDEGQRIIAERRERWAEEDAVKRGQGRSGTADALAIPDLRQPEHLRGQSPDDGIPRPDVSGDLGELPYQTH